MYLYRGHSASTSLSTKKATKNDIEWRACSQKRCPSYRFFYVFLAVTQFFLLYFSDNITVSNKNSTFNKEPTSLSEITI